MSLNVSEECGAVLAPATTVSQSSLLAFMKNANISEDTNMLPGGDNEVKTEYAPVSTWHGVLPQEILDHILTFIDDRKTLLSCCLSSRTLLSMGMKMTLRNLWISRANFRSILRKLMDSPDIASAVRQISCNGRSIPAEGAHRFDELAELALHLNGLVRLNIKAHECMVVDSEMAASQGIILSHTIVHLSLFRTSFNAPNHFLALISALPNLQHLSLESVDWGFAPWNDLPEKGKYRIPKLRALTVKRTRSKIASYLVDDNSIGHLEAFRTDAETRDGWDWWNIWRQRHISYPNLQYLAISGHNLHRHYALPLLPATPNLRSLELSDIPVLCQNPRRLENGFYIRYFLESISGTCVEELRFVFNLRRLTDLDGLDIPNWLSCLRGGRFAQLSKLKYRFVLEEDDGHLENTSAKIVEYVLVKHEGWDKQHIIAVEIIRSKSLFYRYTT